MLEYVNKARTLLKYTIDAQLETEGKEKAYVLYLEGFQAVRGNWKAIFRTSLSNRYYYELAYDKNKKLTSIRKCEVTYSVGVSDAEYDLISSQTFEP